MATKFQEAKNAAYSICWKSYRKKDGTGGLISRPIRQLETDHLINILRTQGQIFESWLGYNARKTRIAIFFILMVERGITEKQLKERIKYLDELEKNSRYPRVNSWSKINSESRYYTNFFKKRWKQLTKRKGI